MPTTAHTYGRAVAINAILYVATLFVTAGILALQGSPLALNQPPSGDQIRLAMVVGIALTTLGAWWYFQRVPASASAGAWFGVIAIVVGLAIDLVLILGLLLTGRDPAPLAVDSYLRWEFPVLLGLAVALPALMGKGMKGKSAYA